MTVNQVTLLSPKIISMIQGNSLTLTNSALSVVAAPGLNGHAKMMGADHPADHTHLSRGC